MTSINVNRLNFDIQIKNFTLDQKINQPLSSLPKAQCFKVGENKSIGKDISDKCKQKKLRKGCFVFYQIR